MQELAHAVRFRVPGLGGLQNGAEALPAWPCGRDCAHAMPWSSSQGVQLVAAWQSVELERALDTAFVRVHVCVPCTMSTPCLSSAALLQE